MTEHFEPFWTVIEEAKPSLRRLAAWLESAPQNAIEQFAVGYANAAEAVADNWDGPSVDGLQYSEDDTADLCEWAVSQGREFWKSAVDREISLVALARLHQRAEQGKLPAFPIWSQDLPDEEYRGWLSPQSLPYCIYERRFAASLDDRLRDLPE